MPSVNPDMDSMKRERFVDLHDRERYRASYLVKNFAHS